MTLEPAELGPVAQKVLATIGEAYLRDGTLEPVSQLLDVPEVASSYRVQVMPIAESRHEGACVVQVRDVSQQVRADRAREDFVAQVTHELRTPLTNIRAYAETLSSGMFDDPKVMTECYNVITKETRRLSRLVEDILSVSQMEAGTIELIEDTVDLKVLMGDAVRDVRGLADEKDIDLQLVLPAKLEPIRGDRDKLAVVINNLLGNALKYTPCGGRGGCGLPVQRAGGRAHGEGQRRGDRAAGPRARLREVPAGERPRGAGGDGDGDRAVHRPGDRPPARGGDQLDERERGGDDGDRALAARPEPGLVTDDRCPSVRSTARWPES